MNRRYFFIVFFLIPLILFSCATSKNASKGTVPLENAVDPRLPSVLEKSKFKIIIEEADFFAERGYVIGLFYDDIHIPFRTVKWNSSDFSKVDFGYFYGVDYMYCLEQGKVEISAEFNSVVVKKEITIMPESDATKLKIIMPENQDSFKGRVVYFTIEYQGKDITPDALFYFFAARTGENAASNQKIEPVLVNRLDGEICRVFCMNEGVSYITVGYKNELILKKITVTEQKDNFYIQIPQNAVFKPDNSVRFFSIYNGKDVTEDSVWIFSYKSGEDVPEVATYTKTKGEIYINNEGGIQVIAEYNGEKAFVHCVSKE